MRYDRIKKAIFLERPNRFIAHILVDGVEEICHVKNTGRCSELLYKGVTIYVQEHDNPKRKTRFSLIGVKKGNQLINMDSQAPNKVVEEWLKAGNLFKDITRIRPETKYGDSRFDFYVETKEKQVFIEVKGVTLEEEKIARFPDAPTERGLKHVHELIHCKKEGYEGYIIFVIQMKGIEWFEPNNRTQPEFGQALLQAQKEGVKILAVDCKVTEEQLIIDEYIPVKLESFDEITETTR